MKDQFVLPAQLDLYMSQAEVREQLFGTHVFLTGEITKEQPANGGQAVSQDAVYVADEKSASLLGRLQHLGVFERLTAPRANDDSNPRTTGKVELAG